MLITTKPCRVLWVDHVDRILGGAEWNLIDLLRAQGWSEGWRFGVACSRHGRLADALEKTGAECWDYSIPEALNRWRPTGRRGWWRRMMPMARALRQSQRQLAHVIEAFDPHCVVSCTNKDAFCVGPVCRRLGRPAVWWFNDALVPEFFPRPVRLAYLWAARRYASRVIAVSDYSRRSLVEGGLRPDRVLAIPNGVPLGERDPRAPDPSTALLEVEKTEPVIGFIGRLTPWKGPLFFLELALEWRRQRRPGLFLLVGQAFNEEAGFEDQLQEFVKKNDLSCQVRFLPFQKDVIPVLRHLTVLVHCSLRPEPFGRVIIEAMAAQVPVVAARAGGVLEIIEHGQNGYLAEPGNLAQYLELIGKIVNSREEQQRLADAGRRTVEQHFTLDRVRSQMETVLKQCCALCFSDAGRDDRSRDGPRTTQSANHESDR